MWKYVIIMYVTGIFGVFIRDNDGALLVGTYFNLLKIKALFKSWL